MTKSRKLQSPHITTASTITTTTTTTTVKQDGIAKKILKTSASSIKTVHAGVRSVLRHVPIKKPPQVVRWDFLGVGLSYMWGKINRKHLPVFMRKPLYQAWINIFKCNQSEIPAPLESYPSLADFFSRPIIEGARPISNEGTVSPVDGRVLACGEIKSDLVEQVKGVTYSISHFLGCDPQTLLKNKDSKLYHCILYLSPGDYHRIHSSEEWSIQNRQHFPGTLFPVNKPFLKLIPSLFALNERIVLTGEWQHGFYSLTAVGAYNVGSISLNFDEETRTNCITRDFRCKNLEYFSWNGVGTHSYDLTYESPIPQERGQEIGQFHLGSTVVLIFEAKDFEFTIKQGDYCKMGSLIGKEKIN
ncbi:hypothetical protein DICPUDRAFT_147678 [Dictyostelium purpureum]|uniref:phosphatidylserine decarboxylase n=1 Tax=Dictyostelium purpureum TaxID=5786 RepID=F0Z944_DICPU|nr:uncharacterized protein DICPUDRAFT_147678 [Dictyostelium purpureum]EGC39514.1 hypothetical protein DICPUDRAFT_147678 [Dictyostelium purpureum]|eukprot:XP_003283961.1 hypothetical protein DICPUDRAFT_147678 [Dictyostelium purpureum]